MARDASLDLPIALRRARRSSSLHAASLLSSPASQTKTATPKPTIQPRHNNKPSSPRSPRPRSRATTPARTPSRRPSSSSGTASRSRSKHVRFSDPGLLKTPRSEGDSIVAATGLTPFLKRTALNSPSNARRHSTPARLLRAADSTGIPYLDPSDCASPFGGEVTFLPLRQVLDGRIKRRIRRNGLSEEMNAILAEKRRRKRDEKKEIERLKEELAQKDAEIQRLSDETLVVDVEKVWRLERTIERLREELEKRGYVEPKSPRREEETSTMEIEPSSLRRNSSASTIELDPSSPSQTDFPPLTDAMSMDDQDDFGDTTIADLDCGTPTRRLSSSFPTPPATSSPTPPELPTPSKRLSLADDTRCDASAQVSLPDPEKQELRDKLALLQLDIDKLTQSLEDYADLFTRLSCRLAPFGKEAGGQPTDLEARLAALLDTLHSQTATLASLDASLKTLGFPGSEPKEIIDSLRASFRTARLELEYLTPGEIPLPLTAESAKVLDLLLSRLRELTQRCNRDEEEVEMLRERERELREQLSARVDAMDALAERLAVKERELGERDARIEELERGREKLRLAVERYAADLAAVEAKVRALEESGAENNATITQLREALAAAEKKESALREELSSLQSAHERLLAEHQLAMEDLVRRHGEEIASRDERIVALQKELERVEEMLTDVQENVVKRLEEENKALEKERDGAREVVVGMRRELVRVLGMGDLFLSGTAQQTAKRGVGEENETAEGEMERERKRRKAVREEAGC